MTPLDTISFRSQIRAFAKEHSSADPHEIARDYADTLSNEELIELARAVLPEALREWIRTVRKRPRKPTSGVSRFVNVSEAYSAGHLRWRDWRVYANGRWCFLAECDRADLLSLAEDYQKRADENTDYAGRYKTAANKLTKAGAATLNDLDPIQVAEIVDPA